MVQVNVEPERHGFCAKRLARIAPWLESYVESGRLPNALVLVTRDGEPVYRHHAGFADVESARPIAPDSIFRIYSMSKAITSVAVMMLYEQGLFQLDDPVQGFIPEVESMRVFVAADGRGLRTEPARSPITVKHLLMHTAGFSYSFGELAPVTRLYQQHKLDFGPRSGTLTEVVERLATVPLVHHPGERWNYGVSTDVLGLLVERASGQRFDEFLRRHVLEPLAMGDTGFALPPEQQHRFTSLYQPAHELGGLQRIDAFDESSYARVVNCYSGGGGLLSTLADYHRFTQMLLNRGELDGVRLLGRKTVDYMTCNHLAGDLTDMGQASFNETSFAGVGFGLGFAVTLDPTRADVIGTAGEYHWGGMASTAFWIDPSERMTVVFMTQLSPSSTYPIRRELRVLTYQALID